MGRETQTDDVVERVALAMVQASLPDPDRNYAKCARDGNWPIWRRMREATIAALSTLPADNGLREALERADRLSDLLDTERYKVAAGIQAIARAVQGRRWLSEGGRGSYTYDDERYQQEFGAALTEIDAALEPLRKIARDWSDCPRDPLRVAANRRAALNSTHGVESRD